MTPLIEGAAERKRLDKVRAELIEIAERIDEIREARLPPAEAAERVMWALQDRCDVARVRLAEYAHARQVGALDDAALGGLLGYLYRDDIEQRVRAHFESEGQDSAIPKAERPAMIEKLEAKQAKLELDEEVEICKLEAAGYLIERRGGVDAATLLEAWDKVSVTTEMQ